MAQPYVGEIRMFAGNFPPAGWMFCDGNLLPISENETLFQLIGTTYGGDGESTFALPNLQSRVPIHQGNALHPLAETGGVEEVTLTVQQIPSHTPSAAGFANLADDPNPALKVMGEAAPVTVSFLEDVAANNMAATAIAPVGGSQPHDELPALSLHQLHHFAVRHLPEPNLGEPCRGRSVRRRNPHLSVQLRPQGVGVLQRAAAAAVAEHGAVLAARHDLWRRRQVDLRAAEPAGQRAAASGPGPGPFSSTTLDSRAEAKR